MNIRTLRSALMSLAVLPVLLAFAPAHAGAIGPYAGHCAGGAGSAVLVKVVGLKNRAGTLRVQSYGGNPRTFFEKGAWQKRIDLPVPDSGLVEVCVPVAQPGTYAFSVRHDANGNGKSDRSDGGGMSGNPDVSLTDVLFKRKPSPKQVGVAVGPGVKVISVVMNYIQGASFEPISTASR